MPTAQPEILILFNPLAGSAHRSEITRLVEKHFSDGQTELLETKGDDVAEILAPYLDGEQRPRLVVAAGGDGTVASVAAQLVNTELPLGILPLGTGNALSRELDIPLRHDQAVKLLAGDYELRKLDVMRVDEEVYMLAVSAGLSAITMRETATEDKKRYGRLAYIWTGILNLFGIPQRDYEVEVDGHTLNVRANEVLLANAGIIGYKPLRWGPDVQPDDGHLDLCFVRARTGLDYLRLLWRLLSRSSRRGETLNCVRVREKAVIRGPVGLPVQADGDDIGETPIEIELVPACLQVAVPPQKK